MVATPGEPITIVPLHNSVQGQTAYRITVYADAPLAVRPIPAAAAAAAAAAVGGAGAVPPSVHDDGEADDDAWSDVGDHDHDHDHDDAAAAGAHGGAGAAPSGSGSGAGSSLSVAFSSLVMGDSGSASSSGPTPEELRVFSLLPPATIRDLAYFSRPPFTALCAAASTDGSSSSSDGSGSGSGGGWSKAVLTSAMPPGITKDDMILMPLTEQVFVTVAAPEGGASGAAAGGEPLLFAFMELLDATGAAFTRPLSTGRLLLCAAETVLPAGSAAPERIPEWEVSPKAAHAGAGAKAGAGAGGKPLWVSDFVLPPERGAPIALPVGCVKLNPVFSGAGDIRTFAICAANCPVPGVLRSRLTIVTNLRLVPPVAGSRAISVSPPE